MTKKILIVDDEQDITTIMKIGLKKSGFDVDTFNEPHTVLEKIQPGAYDLMLLDLKMPQMDGVSLYRKIKEIDSSARVCFITAIDSPDEDLKKSASQLGIDCFIKKPVSMKDLVSKVQAILLSPSS